MYISRAVLAATSPVALLSFASPNERMPRMLSERWIILSLRGALWLSRRRRRGDPKILVEPCEYKLQGICDGIMIRVYVLLHCGLAGVVAMAVGTSVVTATSPATDTATIEAGTGTAAAETEIAAGTGTTGTVATTVTGTATTPAGTIDATTETGATAAAEVATTATGDATATEAETGRLVNDVHAPGLY